jgi:hypothetical protein
MPLPFDRIMANFQDIKAQTGIKFFKSTGTGTDSDPFIPEMATSTTPGEVTNITNFAVTVGTSSTQVLAANSNRKLLILVNDSDETMYVSLGATATLNNGIRLNSNGGALALDDPIFKGIVNAICISGSKKLVGIEG